MSVFEFGKFFGKLLKTLKISGTIKGILDCFFLFQISLQKAEINIFQPMKQPQILG